MESAIYNVAVLDDDSGALKKISRMLNEYSKRNPGMHFEIELFERSIDISESLERISYDLLFLDIYVDRITGIEIAEQVRQDNSDCDIIFITSSEAHYKDAFRLQAAQYLEKPVDENVLFACLDRILKKKQAVFTVSDGRKLMKIPVDSVLYCESDDHYKKIVTDSGTKLVRLTMQELMAEINAPYFYELTTRLIVNLKRIQELTPTTILMENGDVLKLPRGKYRVVADQMLMYIF